MGVVHSIPIIGPVLDPDKPQKVTDTPAYKKTDAFANGIQDQRNNFTNTSASPLTEGATPADQHRGQTAEQMDAQAAKIRAQLDAMPKDKNGAPVDSVTADRLATQLQKLYADADEARAHPPDNNTYIDPTGRDAQKKALGLDEAAATGLAPSAAEQQFRKGIDEGTQTQLGIAATLQGSNPGMALRQGLQGAANVQTRSAADAAALRADEMAKARAQFDAASATTRGQTQDLAKANQDADLRQQMIDHQYELGLTDAQLKALLAQMGGAQTDVTNANNFELGQQQFWGSALASGAKAAGGGK